jgi:hypothetical protein
VLFWLDGRIPATGARLRPAAHDLGRPALHRLRLPVVDTRCLTLSSLLVHHTLQMKRPTFFPFLSFLALLSQSWAAPAYVQGNTAQITSGGASRSLSATFAGAQRAGNFNVVIVGWNDNGSTTAVSSVTDSAGNTYVQAQASAARKVALSQAIFYAKNIVVNPRNTVTAHFSGTGASFPEIRIAEYRGIDTPTPLDASSTAAGHSGTPTAAAITTSAADDLIVCGLICQSAMVTEVGDGFINRLTGGFHEVLEDQGATAAGEVTHTDTLNNWSDWVIQLAAFKARARGPMLTARARPSLGLLTDGNAATVQAAINAASDGATIVIPNGTWTWRSPVRLRSKAITLKGESAGGVIIQNANTARGSQALSVEKSPHGIIDISNLYFTSIANGGFYHLTVGDPSPPYGKPVLLHDCTFVSNPNGVLYAVTWYSNGGVIYNCHFHSGGAYICGIQTYSANSDWMRPDTFGSHDTGGTKNTYIEDCDFHNAWTACTNFDDNSRVVFRHNLVDNCSVSDHGQETSPYGVRQQEIYNNTFVYTGSGNLPAIDGGGRYPINLQNWIFLRGGTALIYNNIMPPIPYKDRISMAVFSITRACQIPPPSRVAGKPNWPAARQVGQGWSGGPGSYSYNYYPADGTGYITDPIYLWNNTDGQGNQLSKYVALTEYSDEVNSHQVVSDYLRVNRDYYYARKDGYTPYTYPHPLRGTHATPGPTPARFSTAESGLAPEAALRRPASAPAHTPSAPDDSDPVAPPDRGRTDR